MRGRYASGLAPGTARPDSTAEPVRDRGVRRRPGQARLPRAGLADERDHAASPLGEVAHPDPQQVLLPGPAHEVRAQHARILGPTPSAPSTTQTSG